MKITAVGSEIHTKHINAVRGHYMDLVILR